jgi:carboxyl-terminal processing protease
MLKRIIYMNRRNKFLGVLALLFFLSGYVQAQEYFEQTYKLGKVLEWINKYYVDSVDENALVEHAIVDMLNELDPHSSYLSKDEVAEINEPLQGNFDGIGVSFNLLNDTVYVISTVKDGPSEKAGILRGDRLIKVDGANIAGIGINSERVYSLLRGTKGSKVNVSVFRKDTRQTLDFEITRDKIPIYSVDAAYKVTDGIGYIKINRFSAITVDEFKEAVSKFNDEHIDNLILDLTGNGGGILDAAINLADQFLDGGKLILYTQGTNSPRKEYHATRDGVFEKGHLVILIDEGSASASEIVTGAVQDWDRGIIVGRRSYGKGLVQRALLLPDQSMIRLTTAKYYTPTGRLIQKPYHMNHDEYEKDLVYRYLKGEMAHKDSIHLPDSLKFYTLKNTRLVYGGGGIMPDYFVSIDTSFYSEYYRQLLRNRIMDQYVLTYVDAHRKDLLSAYPEITAFSDNFTVGDDMMNSLVQYAEDKGILRNDKDLVTSGEQIRRLVKSYLARDLWSNSEFYQINNLMDPKFETAVTILKNWDKYEAMLLNKK